MPSKLTGHLLANPVVAAMQQLQHVTPWHKYFGWSAPQKDLSR